MRFDVNLADLEETRAAMRSAAAVIVELRTAAGLALELLDKVVPVEEGDRRLCPVCRRDLATTPHLDGCKVPDTAASLRRAVRLEPGDLGQVEEYKDRHGVIRRVVAVDTGVILHQRDDHSVDLVLEDGGTYRIRATGPITIERGRGWGDTPKP